MRQAWYYRVLRIVRVLLTYAVLLTGAVIALGPFVWMVSTSLMTLGEAISGKWIPSALHFENYVIAWREANFALYFWNSVRITLITLAGELVFSILAAYAFARMRFPGRGLLFSLILGSMMVPFVVTIVPLYWMAVKWFKIYDTLWGLIIVWTSGSFSFGVFMMTQFFKQIPRDLEEAAFMDGAGWFTLFFRVVLPLARPALLALAIFSFQGSWNDFFLTLIMMQSPENFTLPLGLAMFRFQYYAIYSNVLAGSIFNSLPIIIIFFIFQRYFVEGIAYTGLKGT